MEANTQAQHWFFRYKIYHIPFWVAYHTLWMVIHSSGKYDEMFAYLFGGSIPVKFLGYIFFQAFAVYFNLYFLIPKYLYLGKYKTYFLWLVTTILICTAFIVGGYYVAPLLTYVPANQLYSTEFNEIVSLYAKAALPSTAASMTLAMSIKLGKNWLNAERKRHALEKDKLETELKYLKAQINPHFLFNTINSIFVLIHKNPDLASESLANFSEMLRYQLYECNDQEISLTNDLQFLENFIELETLRLNEKQTELSFEIDHESAQGFKIAPFILLPFVENAFKHVSKGKTQKNFIKLQCLVNDSGVLELMIENSYSGVSNMESSGIGLKNVKRRLDLVYPEKYQLEIDKGTDTFKVCLSVNLKSSHV